MKKYFKILFIVALLTLLIWGSGTYLLYDYIDVEARHQYIKNIIIIYFIIVIPTSIVVYQKEE